MGALGQGEGGEEAREAEPLQPGHLFQSSGLSRPGGLGGILPLILVLGGEGALHWLLRRRRGNRLMRRRQGARGGRVCFHEVAGI